MYGHKKLGASGEQAAAEFLISQGYGILERNYSAPVGEIDIIAARENTISFVEVKTRKSTVCGTPAQAVNYYKQQKIIRTAKWYISSKHIDEDSYYFSFDVVEVYAAAGKFTVRHIKNAFEL